MKKLVVLSVTILVALFGALFILSGSTPAANAQPQNPSDYASAGLVYEGLSANDPDCKQSLKIAGRSGRRALCTHGPDAAPKNFNIKNKVAPVVYALSRPGSISATPTPTPSTGIVCDGDGVSGYRVQVLYVRSSDVPDSYATYLPSFKTWVGGMDAIFNNSAAQTGGTRHIRFVHDSKCNPVIPAVVLSPAGDDNFTNTINELEAMGYSRTDRKYVIFMDSRVYCGISTMSFDDSPNVSNPNNIGDTFGRIDAGCWSDVIPAHELMHQLGGVQLSAPHSSGESHCYDGYDDMCRPTNNTTIQMVCSNIAQGSLLDCGHDDYYNTNPANGSYLATHWNSANSVFLIIPSNSTTKKK